MVGGLGIIDYDKICNLFLVKVMATGVGIEVGGHDKISVSAFANALFSVSLPSSALKAKICARKFLMSKKY